MMWHRRNSMLKVTILLVAICLHTSDAAAAVNCNPFSQKMGGTCDETHAGETYKELKASLKDASQQESTGGYVLKVTLEMYRYLHPCASNVEAALVLFYGFDDSEVPADTAGYWSSPHVLDANSHLLIGRRRRQDQHFPSFEDLLKYKLQNITTHDGTTACIQGLIDEYKDRAFRQWMLDNPDFETPPPNTHSGDHAAEPRTTTQKTTTTTMPRTARCYQCNGLQCLLRPAPQPCPNGENQCFTTVVENNGSREISRGCLSDSSQCTQPSSPCKDVETSVTAQGTQCTFCCNVDECNTPPGLIPTVGVDPRWRS